MSKCKWEVGEWYSVNHFTGYLRKVLILDVDVGNDKIIIARNEQGSIFRFGNDGSELGWSSSKLATLKIPPGAEKFKSIEPKTDETPDKIKAKIRDIRDLCNELEAMV